MKPADTENRNGKVTITVFAGSRAGDGASVTVSVAGSILRRYLP